MPRVTAIEGREKVTTSSPLNSPASMVTQHIRIAATQIGAPISERRAKLTVATATMAGSEMSISPTRTTNMKPTAMIPVIAIDCCRE